MAGLKHRGYPTFKKTKTLGPKYRPILLKTLKSMNYKLSLQQDKLKGKPLTAERKEITNKQTLVEELQHQISKATN